MEFNNQSLQFNAAPTASPFMPLQHNFMQMQVPPRLLPQIKQHQLPLARIKRVMKADEDVKMISADTPVLFAKACELFILELTLRSWFRAEDGKRRVLQRSDIAHAVTHSEVLDFLLDIVPTEEAEAKLIE
ncbi:PREDICTED: nuclear transcription factor Y subunit C-2-like [Nelumbo nucifera]|uniref:Nuclear transcription factor Y subunit C-2-like n=1 Tax=Nelumbo nucifera TaxID=4432 RepID=A0A1U8BD65_NELNU|nr:PREDICTED: nuclear transcription factor Y subunit C-2-like [Nelumbo nucifera]